MKPSCFHGLLVVDKPGGMTSREVVDRVQAWFPANTRIGHTGTLDPLATGVLVLCLGAATRLAEYVQQMAKTYRTVLRLGARSDTDDADGAVLPVAGAVPPDLDDVRTTLAGFVGDIAQVPPAYSAAHVTGQRAYKLARHGKEVLLSARQVRVYGIHQVAYAFPRLELEIHCGKGTYIRALARDLGERLGCGALVQTLRRTAVGPFNAEEALSLDANVTGVTPRLLPLSAAVAELPRVVVVAEAVVRLRQGQGIPLTEQGELALEDGQEAAAFDQAGALVGVVRADRSRRLLLPSKILSMSGAPD